MPNAVGMCRMQSKSSFIDIDEPRHLGKIEERNLIFDQNHNLLVEVSAFNH